MFKDKLKKLRMSMGLTQQQLADKLYISRSLIAKWEQGRSVPQEDMLQMLVDFFDVDRSHFYDKDEPNKLIEKLFKKNRLYLGVGSLIFLALLVFVGVFIYDKVNKEKILYNTFYSDSYLEKMQVSGLRAIFPNNEGSMLYNNTYYMDVNNQSDIHDYASYIYDYLVNSFEVTYVGFSIDIALEASYETRNPKDLRTFIKGSSVLTDYVDYSGYQTSYTFYYLTSKHKKHEAGNQINPYRISITYGEENIKWGLQIDGTHEFRNFSMTLFEAKPQTSNKYLVGHYMFDDYYTFEEGRFSTDSIMDYFTLEIYEGDDFYTLYMRPKAFIFKYYLETKIVVGHDETSIIFNKVVTRFSNDIKFIKSELASFDKENMLEEFEVLVDHGYFYQIHEK